MKRVLFLSKYTALAASSRYRIYQYIDSVTEAGFQCAVRPLFSDGYLQGVFSAHAKHARLRLTPEIVHCLIKRWWLLVREAAHYDIVFLQYEALPYIPLWFSRALIKSQMPIISDYDDAINVNYDSHPNPILRHLLGANIPQIVRRSAWVITGSNYMAEWAGHFNPNVSVIPTSVDMRKYVHAIHESKPNAKTVIGWIGTPLTANYLALIADSLRELRTKHEFVLKVIGAPAFALEGIQVIAQPWSEATEIAELASCDIGIMPVPDDAWGRGKSAFKLIQYLAAGVAAVASPVGANRDVVSDGINGFLAGTTAEWTNRLGALIENPELRSRFALAGPTTVSERYSMQVNAPRFVEVLQRAEKALFRARGAAPIQVR